MIRINTGADVADLFGGQTDFAVAVELWGAPCDTGCCSDCIDIIGAGHTVAEAVADARKTMRGWRHANDCPECGAAESACDCGDPTEMDYDPDEDRTP